MIRRTRNLLMVLTITLLLVLGSAASFTALHAQGGVTGFANLRITNFYRSQPRTTLVLAANGTLNATGTNQPISATAAIGTSGANITVKPAGTLLILRNVGSNTITFTETGTLISAGNIALGQNDSATLLSDGTSWFQIGASNN